eukprot:TRINITY_DN12745_c1_g1_i1.p1 TRINITY_DN12745_c1_g1~~TRINITY_DN12745_c1_g1_i1.p1  ORF type:complete len:426 (-),score=74.25 TRINITY_DN12745_c1_g1_i1:91-1368(-)
MMTSPQAETPEEQLLSVLLEVERLNKDVRAWENERETIFELLRRSCLSCAKLDLLDAPRFTGSHIEEAWLFLLELRRVNPVRRRRIEECMRALLQSPTRWSRVLHESQRVQEATANLGAEACSALFCDKVDDIPQQQTADGVAEEVPAPWPPSTLPVLKVNGNAWPPPAAAHANNPFEASSPSRFKTMSPKATAGADLFSASLHPQEESDVARGQEEEPSVGARIGQGIHTAASKTREANQRYGVTEKIGQGAVMAGQGVVTAVSKTKEANQKYGVTDKIGQGVVTAVSKTREANQKYGVTDKIGQGAVTAVQKTREANQKYGVTEKIGQGATTAVSKTREFEQKHHVTSRVASGISSGATEVGKMVSHAKGGPERQAERRVAQGGHNPFTQPRPQAASNPFRQAPSANPFSGQAPRTGQNPFHG